MSVGGEGECESCSEQAPRTPSRAGFTILELLVCIAVIGVLLAILLPALRQSRESAVKIAILSNQRDSATLVVLYTNDYRGLFPAYGMERTMVANLDWKQQAVAGGWWEQMEYWGLFLQMKGYEGWISMGPGAKETVYENIDCIGCGHARSVYLLMGAAFAEPAQFVSPRQQDESRFHIVQKIEGVLNPSQKGMLLGLLAMEDHRRPVSFVDGHSEWFSDSELIPGADTDLPYAPTPVLQTRDGVRGRDR